MRMPRPALIASLLLAGCAPASLPQSLPETPPVTGQIEGGPARATQASMAQIASGATISLIEPSTGNTLATTLSDVEGHFTLSFKNGFRPGSEPYFLEAMKGLSNNGAGATLLRLRTLIARQNGQWIALSGRLIVLNRSTTALTALSNLKGLSEAENRALMGCLSLNLSSTVDGILTPDTYTTPESLTEVLTDGDFHQAWSMVDQAVSRDMDPIAALFTRSATGSPTGEDMASESFGIGGTIGWLSDGFVLSSLSATTIARGGTLTLRGHGLATTTSGARVTLGPGGAECPVTAAGSNGSSLTVAIPPGVSPGTYALQLIIGRWTATRTVTVT